MKNLIVYFKLFLVAFLFLPVLACNHHPPRQEVMPVILLINHYPIWSEDKEFFKRINPYGFLLSIPKHPDMDPNKLRLELEEVLGRKDFLFFLDQEGGSVNRLKQFNKDFQSPSASSYGLMAKKDLKQAISEARKEGARTGRELKKFSIDVVFAPVADTIESDNVPRRERYYSTDPHITKALADAFAQGIASEGVTPCYKHFPGFVTREDPHNTQPKIYARVEKILSKVYPAFSEAKKYGCLMPGHAIYPELDQKNTSTYSESFYLFMRESLHFDGIVITDALNMKAAGGPHIFDLGERMNKALAAGADVVIPLFAFHEPVEIMEAKIRQIDPKYIKRFQSRVHLLKRRN